MPHLPVDMARGEKLAFQLPDKGFDCCERIGGFRECVCIVRIENYYCIIFVFYLSNPLLLVYYRSQRAHPPRSRIFRDTAHH